MRLENAFESLCGQMHIDIGRIEWMHRSMLRTRPTNIEYDQLQDSNARLWIYSVIIKCRIAGKKNE